MSENYPAPKIELIDLASIAPKPIDWLWEGWLAAGQLHLIAGPPGVGKTTVAMALAAILSSAGRWPDGTQAQPADVLIWSGEDDIERTIVPRLMAGGADLGRIRAVGGVCEEDGLRPFDPATDIQQLETQMVGRETKLLIVDPIVTAVAGDSHKNAEVRRGLQPLVDLGRETNAAIFGITHYAKGSKSRDPMERVIGSIAFSALARMVMGTAKLAEDHEEAPGRILVRAKSNLGPDGDGFIFDLNPAQITPEIEVRRVDWGRPIDGTARQLLAQAEVEIEPEERTERDDAKDFLINQLRDGPKDRPEIIKAARKEGITEPTLKRARAELGIVSKRTGFSQSARWSMPEKPAGPKSSQSANRDLNGDRDLNDDLAHFVNAGGPHSDHLDPQAKVEPESDLNVDDMLIKAAEIASLNGNLIDARTLRNALSAEDMADPELMNVDWLVKYARSLQGGAANG